MLRQLAAQCETAVITLGRNGCVAMRRGGDVVRGAAVADVECVDSTGAGDLFASGFLFALFHDLNLEACLRMGALSGAAVIKVWESVASAGSGPRVLTCQTRAQGYGAEVSPEAWAWARAKVREVPLARNAPAFAPPITDAADAPASQSDSSYF